jgi:predicted TIM-barrel fold metal-dependent hydrolase
MAQRHPQVWLDTTNVFASIALAPAAARADLARAADALFDAAPDRVFFGTDYPAAMGSLEQLHAQVAQAVAGEPRTELLAANALRFVSGSFEASKPRSGRALPAA